jgi:hypothetical protein
LSCGIKSVSGFIENPKHGLPHISGLLIPGALDAGFLVIFDALLSCLLSLLLEEKITAELLSIDGRIKDLTRSAAPDGC